MKSTMSGWSALSTTIFAARRVLPPDLITPAEASAARMNETGPEAVPPPPSRSFDERSRERFTPDPEPPLKMTPSLRYQSIIGRREVALRPAPLPERAHHPADQLAHAALALRRTQSTAEVLRDDDVGR